MIVKIIKTLSIKYRFRDLIYYFFTKNKFSYHFITSKPTLTDQEFLDLFNKYKKSTKKENINLSIIWKAIINDKYKELTRSFNNNDIRNFRKLMNNFFNSSVILGAEDGNLYKNFILKISHKVHLIKSIYFISNYLSITKVENYFQISKEKKRNIKELYKSIEARIPIINVPSIGSPYGMQWKDSIINFRFLESVYWNLTIKNFLQINLLDEKVNILEIGGGSGINSFVTYKFLRNNINEFYCVDIPHFLLFQEYFIMSSILEKNIQKKFIFCPSNEINLIIKKQFKIFLNKDSLPEIDGTDSKIYYDIISKNKGAFFFSINHESTSKNQKSVSENLSKYDNIKLIKRDLYPLRDGYVSEIYYVQ